MQSVTSNAVANYIPQSSYTLIAKGDVQGYLAPTESWSEIHYIRLAVGSWSEACKLFITFDSGNIADRIEITILNGNTDIIQCYGLFATNSNLIKNLYICYGDTQDWNSNWTLWVGLLIPYGCYIHVSKIINYVGNVNTTVDSDSTSEPSNIIHNISLTGGFFKSN